MDRVASQPGGVVSLVGSFASGVGRELAPHAVASIVGATPTASTLEAREAAANATIARYGGPPEFPWGFFITGVVVGFLALEALSSPARGRARRGDNRPEIV